MGRRMGWTGSSAMEKEASSGSMAWVSHRTHSLGLAFYFGVFGRERNLVKVMLSHGWHVILDVNFIRIISFFLLMLFRHNKSLLIILILRIPP
jgi:hypothetical protein